MKKRQYGGWAVDGIEYSSARKAAQAIGMGKETFTERCGRIGRRRVTSAELLAAQRRSGNNEWRRLNDARNTGAGRGEHTVLVAARALP